MSLQIPEPISTRNATRRVQTGDNPYLPAPARIMRVADLTADIRLFELRFSDPSLAESFTFRPGQFIELSILGVGEGPFSLPSAPTRKGMFQLGIRRTGRLTDHLFHHIREGDEVGIRGPLGNGFPVERFEGQDLLLIAGGLGMVPLRGLLQYLMDLRSSFGRVILLYGSRNPEAVLFQDELVSLSRRGDAEITLTVDDVGALPWDGKVGYVTELLDQVSVDVSRAHSIVCGPPVFYKYVLDKLVTAGFAKDRIFLNLERRMECGVGKCGHCAVGYTFTCVNGPVFTMWEAINLPELIT